MRLLRRVAAADAVVTPTLDQRVRRAFIAGALVMGAKCGSAYRDWKDTQHDVSLITFSNEWDILAAKLGVAA